MSESIIPMLSEHQAYPQESSADSAGYQPSPEEKAAIKLAFSKFEQAKKFRKKYDEKWLDYYRMFRGKQWKEQRPSYRHSEVINFIFQSIQSTVPIQTDNRPKFEFLGQEPMDQEFAEILNELAASDWERNNWLMTLTEIVYDANFYGAGFGGCEFDQRERDGMGGIVFDSKDPFHMFPDPESRNVNDPRRGCYFVEAEPVGIQRLKREYPKVADFIKPDLMDMAKGDNKTSLDQVRFKSPVDNKSILEGTSAYDLANSDQTLKITLWIHSDDFDEKEKREKNEAGEEVVSYEQVKKYPRGRKICITSNGVLLEDIENPYEDGKFPYARLLNYILPREFWGISEVEQLESPQKIFNKLVSFSLDVLTLMGNPIWVVGTSSGVDTDNLFNRPGLVVEADDVNQVERQEGVQLQPFVLQLIDRLQSWFDGISGANDVTRGVKPESVTAASAIQSLQEASQTRIRLKSRLMDAFLQDFGQMWLSRALQFYTTPMVYRLTGKDGAQKYFKFSVDTQTDESGNTTKIARVRRYQPGEDGQIYEGEEEQYQIRGDFDVRVTTGSGLPFAKLEKFGIAKELFQLQAIDREELLKAADYPNWQAVLQRVTQQEQQMAQAKAAQQQGGQPPAA